MILRSGFVYGEEEEDMVDPTAVSTNMVIPPPSSPQEEEGAAATATAAQPSASVVPPEPTLTEFSSDDVSDGSSGGEEESDDGTPLMQVGEESIGTSSSSSGRGDISDFLRNRRQRLQHEYMHKVATTPGGARVVNKDIATHNRRTWMKTKLATTLYYALCKNPVILLSVVIAVLCVIIFVLGKKVNYCVLSYDGEDHHISNVTAYCMKLCMTYNK